MKQRLDAGAGRAYDRMSGTNDLQTGVESGIDDFERFYDRASDIAKRMRIARDILRQNGGAQPEEPDLSRGRRLPSLVQPAGPAVSLNSSAGSNDGRSRVAVDLTFNGAPDGMRHGATTNCDGVEMGSVQVRKAMTMSGG